MTIFTGSATLSGLGVAAATASVKHGSMVRVLAAVHRIAPEDLPAFEGTLRYLRNHGLPKIKPGSGRKIEYNRRMVLEISIAVELIRGVGQPPQLAARVAPAIVGQYDGSATFWVRVKRGEPLITLAGTEKAFEELLQEAVASFSLVNVAHCALQVDAALDRVAAAAD